MKLKNLLFCLCSIVTLTSSAIEPVAQLFIAMPDSLVPSIEVNRRKDLIDLMHAGQKAEIVTKLGSKAEMTLLQDSLLSIDLSKRSKMEYGGMIQPATIRLSLLSIRYMPRRETVAYGFSTLHGRNSPLRNAFARYDGKSFSNSPIT